MKIQYLHTSFMERKTPLITDKFYHVYNRGVRKMKIFREARDQMRFIDLMAWYLKMDYPYSKFLSRKRQALKLGSSVEQLITAIGEFNRLKTPPVEIAAWVLMPNHYHLVLKQAVDDGVTHFMRRLGTAYAHYFNRKYDQEGALFGQPFQSVWVRNEAQFLHVCRYVHINPVAAKLAKMRDLDDYSWSSLPVYLEGKSDKVTVPRELLKHFDDDAAKLEKLTKASFNDYEQSIIEGVTLDDDFDWYAKSRAKKKQRREEAIRRNLA